MTTIALMTSALTLAFGIFRRFLLVLMYIQKAVSYTSVLHTQHNEVSVTHTPPGRSVTMSTPTEYSSSAMSQLRVHTSHSHEDAQSLSDNQYSTTMPRYRFDMSRFYPFAGSARSILRQNQRVTGISSPHIEVNRQSSAFEQRMSPHLAAVQADRQMRHKNSPVPHTLDAEEKYDDVPVSEVQLAPLSPQHDVCADGMDVALSRYE